MERPLFSLKISEALPHPNIAHIHEDEFVKRFGVLREGAARLKKFQESGFVLLVDFPFSLQIMPCYLCSFSGRCRFLLQRRL
jgi:hypothetical protein